MEQETKRCPYCGHEILAVAKKCRYCGHWLDGSHQEVATSVPESPAPEVVKEEVKPAMDQPEHVQVPTNKPKKPNIKLWNGIIAVLAIIVIVLATLCIKNGVTPKYTQFQKDSVQVGKLLADQTLNDCNDSLSYAIGYAQSDGVKGYTSENAGVDTTKFNNFLYGVVDACMAEDTTKIRDYQLGLQLGNMVNVNIIPQVNAILFGEGTDKTCPKRVLLRGIFDGINGSDFIMSQVNAEEIANRLVPEIQNNNE